MPKTTPRSVRKPTIAAPHVPNRVERTPLDRIWYIQGCLFRQETITAVMLAAKFEVTSLTIKRDIAMMRDRLGMPVEWDSVRKTYYFTRECDTLPLLRISAREALMLAVVGRVIEGWQGTAVGRDLDGIVKKIAPVLGGAVSIAVDSIDRILTLSATDGLRELEHFFPILEALLERKQLRIEYAKAPSTQAKKRLVHPLQLARSNERWVLVAHDPARGAVRTFVLTRIRKVVPTEATFEPPKNFDVQKYLRGCLGGFAGDQEHEVRIALDLHAAFYAREKPWHSSQQLTERLDGRVELTLRLNHLADAKNAVLRWGEHAEVLGPPELRAEVRASLKAALAQYAEESTTENDVSG